MAVASCRANTTSNQGNNEEISREFVSSQIRCCVGAVNGDAGRVAGELQPAFGKSDHSSHGWAAAHHTKNLPGSVN